MKAEILKAKLIYRIFFNIVFIVFLALFFYQLIFYSYTFIEQINLLLLLIMSVIWLRANFYKDRYKRIYEKKEIVDFWLFYIMALNRMFEIKEMLNFFILFPKLKKQGDNKVEKVRVKLNIYIISFYALMTIFILSIIMI